MNDLKFSWIIKEQKKMEKANRQTPHLQYQNLLSRTGKIAQSMLLFKLQKCYHWSLSSSLKWFLSFQVFWNLGIDIGV